MVLATEMKQHFEHLSKFINSINKSVLKYDTDSGGPEVGVYRVAWFPGCPLSVLVFGQLQASAGPVPLMAFCLLCACTFIVGVRHL